ncbi:MAG: ABC transporter ATP-binding protein [Lachnospiraceae bacterium]|jgi:branched-chain amino acid transport system ATP-binding protein|nr:ABC transporter ATP-binding protein [Lachnospiraceae bacterium]
MMLEIKDLTVKYGGITAVDGISLHVDRGEIVALVGANGAGKSTTLLAVSSLVKIASGQICFEEEDVTKLPADAIVRRGLVQVPEGRQIFTKLTVAENLLMGSYVLSDHARAQKNQAFVMELFPILKERAKQSAGTLSGGEQQMLAIGRALMSSPKMLLLDEPSLGLSPILTQQVFDVLKGLKQADVTVLLIEQNAYDALEISDRAYIMETGQITLEGRCEDLLHDERIISAYLGGDL